MHMKKVKWSLQIIVLASIFFFVNLGMAMATINEVVGEERNNMGVTATLVLLIVAGALAFNVYWKKRNKK